MKLQTGAGRICWYATSHLYSGSSFVAAGARWMFGLQTMITIQRLAQRDLQEIDILLWHSTSMNWNFKRYLLVLYKVLISYLLFSCFCTKFCFVHKSDSKANK